MLIEATLLAAGLAVGAVGGAALHSRRGEDGHDESPDSTGSYRALADNFPRGSVALYDGSLEYTRAAGSVVAGSDADPETLEGKSIGDVFGADFEESHREAYEAVFEGEEATFEEKHDGRHYRRRLVPVTEDGEVVAGLEATRDVTETKRRQDALAASEQRYRTLAENFPRGVVALFDEELTYTLTDGGVFDHINQSAEDFVGHGVDEVHTDGFLELHRDKFVRCFEGEQSSFTFSHGNRVYRTQLVPVRDADGDVDAGMSLTTDITALKERERELQRQNERLEEFASIVSHDLRNPLDVAMGRLSVIETDDDQHVQVIREELRRMESIISDMLTLARQGRAVEDPREVELEAVAADAWANVATGGATLETDLDRTVSADPDRVLQVFENLFRNAVEHGGETVTVGDTDDGFYVADDGPGIPAENREQVFDHGHTSSDEGTGLGLAIVENVADAHGWSVSLAASADGGARFEFAVDGSVLTERDGTEPTAPTTDTQGR